MKFLLLVVFLPSCFQSNHSNCKNNVELVLINNKSEYSEVIFSNGIDSIFIQSKNGSTVKRPLCFSDNVKTDGCYIIKVKNAKKDTILNWGYYSNGIPSEKSIEMKLENDSINIKSKDFRTY